MLHFMAVIHACLCVIAPTQIATAPAGQAQAVECQQAPGYAPAIPFTSGLMAAPTALGAVPWPLLDAWYAESNRKTFFVYLAARESSAPGAAPTSPIRVSFFDNASGTVPKPSILPLESDLSLVTSLRLIIDAQGHIWVCAGLVGRPCALFKSTKPHDISSFTRLSGPALDDPQLFHIAGQGFIVLGLHRDKARIVPCFATSRDGLTWSDTTQLANIDTGHTFIAAQFANKIGVALAAYSYSAREGPLSADRIYYLETIDLGKTWQDIRRATLKLPFTDQEQGPLAWDYRKAHWTVCFKDMDFTKTGRPIILYLNGRPAQTGQPPVYTWTTLRWVPRGWETAGLLWAASPLDCGVLYLEPNNVWRLLAARNAPSKTAAHEEIVFWYTDDQGRSWRKQAGIATPPSDRHLLARPRSAQPDLYALWVMGKPVAPHLGPMKATPPGSKPAPLPDPLAPSIGQLLLLTRDAHASLLPAVMTGAKEKPQPAPVTSQPATRPAIQGKRP